MTDSWIGGDIAGLQTMGSTLTGAKEDLEAVVKPLSSGVDKLISDAGWQGEAAEEFRGRWIEDAMAAGGFAELVKSTGDALTSLAQALSDANSALQDAADAAQRKGVPVGPTGAPGSLLTADPPSAADQKTIADLNEYSTVYNEIVTRAQSARLDCARTLEGLFRAIDPHEPALSKGDKIVVADYLRGLWTAKVDGERKLGLESKDKLADAEKEYDEAYAAMKGEEAKFRTAEADLPKAFRLRGEYQRAAAHLDALDADIARAENSTFLPYDKALNYKLADALRGTRLVEGAPEFLRELPVLDVVAAGAIGVVEAKEDHDKGWSWKHSLTVDVGAGMVGLGVGAAAALALPEMGVAATAAAAGGIVVVTSYAVDEAFHEHWSEDIHDHGVVMGIADGTGHVAKNTYEDTKNLVTGTGKSIGHGAKKVWHSLGF